MTGQRHSNNTLLHLTITVSALLPACLNDGIASVHGPIEQTPLPLQNSPRAPLEPLVVTDTTPLAAVVGRYGPDRSPEQFYASDLGWTVQDRDRLWVLFGDSWANPLTTKFDIAGRQDADDAIGFIDLEQFPDGESVERWIASHPAPIGAFPWQAAPPTLNMSRSPERGVATPLRLSHDGEMLRSGRGLTPIAGFSNARTDESAALFGVFFHNHPVECASGACEGGLSCDTGLGVCIQFGQEREDMSMPCVLGSPPTQGCDRCEAVPSGGLCVDTRTSIYAADVLRGRSASVAATHEVGNLLHDSDHVFATQSWVTKRFYNATARSVRDFDPARSAGMGNDYRPADGAHSGRDGVFLWGRPGFGGIHREGRDAQLYLAWVPMPSYAQDGHFEWKPQHFAGVDAEGRPTFVEREIDSVPLDLDAAQSGDQPQEIVDVTNQMSVSYLPSLDRFIMIYGGDLYGAFLDLLYAEDAPHVDHALRGPLYVRYAKNPWGPWTAPEVFAEDGDRSVPSGFYASGGILCNNLCLASDCLWGDLNLLGDEGWLYGPSIIDPWTREREDGVDVYWHVSTWNPYAVMLMKSSLRPMPVRTE